MDQHQKLLVTQAVCNRFESMEKVIESDLVSAVSALIKAVEMINPETSGEKLDPYPNGWGPKGSSVGKSSVDVAESQDLTGVAIVIKNGNLGVMGQEKNGFDTQVAESLRQKK